MAPRVEAPPESTDRNPFTHQSVNQEEVLNGPINPGESLELEENHSVNERINNLIENVRDGTFREQNKRNRDVERYGAEVNLSDPMAHPVANFRALCAGEFDVGWHDTAEGNGRAERNFWTEAGRRCLNVVVKSGRSTLIAAGVSAALLTVLAGAGVISGAAVVGGITAVALKAGGINALVRGGHQVYELLSGREANIRKKLLTAEKRNSQKIESLADRIPNESDIPDSPDPTTALDRLNYERRRNRNITDLINLAFDSEQQGVELQYDVNGNPIVQTELRGQTLDEAFTGQPDADDDDPDTDSRRKMKEFVKGTEVTQSSDRSPDAKTIGGLRKQLREYVTGSNKRENLFTLIASLGYSADQLLHVIHGSSDAVETLTTKFADKFAHGQGVSLDIDGDHVYHTAKSTIDLTHEAGARGHELMANYNAITHTNPDKFVFDYNSPGEAANALQSASVAGQTLNVSLELTHTLGTDGVGVFGAMQSEAVKEVSSQLASFVVGMIADRAIGNRVATNYTRRDEENAKSQYHNEEVRRHRYQPGSLSSKAEHMLTEAGRQLPKAGQEWHIPAEHSEDGKEHFIIASEIDEDRAMVKAEFLPPDKPGLIKMIPMELFRYYTEVRPRPGDKPAAAPAGAPGTTPPPPETAEAAPVAKVKVWYETGVLDPALAGKTQYGEIDLTDGMILSHSTRTGTPSALKTDDRYEVKVDTDGNIRILKLELLDNGSLMTSDANAAKPTYTPIELQSFINGLTDTPFSPSLSKLLTITHKNSGVLQDQLKASKAPKPKPPKKSP